MSEFKIGDRITYCNGKLFKGVVISKNDSSITVKFDERWSGSLTEDGCYVFIKSLLNNKYDSLLKLYREPLIIISDVDPYGEEDWNE